MTYPHQLQIDALESAIATRRRHYPLPAQAGEDYVVRIW